MSVYSSPSSNGAQAPYVIGIAGLGTVGCGVIAILQSMERELADKIGRTILVKMVSAQNRAKERPVDIGRYQWVDDALEMADDPEIDCIVEMIGGSDGPAKALVEKALANGKAVVTANKALMAFHGAELAKAAEGQSLFLGFEAAVAGGIPAIKILRESLGGNRVTGISGILNGTCNYILTTMRESGRSFDDVLAEAQALGYAEADPSFDIDGIDAAHKLAILCAIAFGVKIDFSTLPVTGIRHIQAGDIAYATQLGYRIKLLGLARSDAHGKVSIRVEPCFVKADSQIGAVESVFNAVIYDAEPVDRIMVVGRGAGAGPTASAVLSDILDAAQGAVLPVYARPCDQLVTLDKEFATRQQDEESRFYLRLRVLDVPGVVADVATVLKNYQISISVVSQEGRAPKQPVDVVFVLHEASEKSVADACRDLSELQSVLERPTVLRIEDL